MKRVVAFFKPNMLGDVIGGLHEIPDFPGAAISEVRGIGQGMREHIQESGHEPFHGFPVSTRMEIICRCDLVEPITRMITQRAHTGLHGDGKIYVSAVEDAIRIRTGERGEEAI